MFCSPCAVGANKVTGHVEFIARFSVTSRCLISQSSMEICQALSLPLHQNKWERVSNAGLSTLTVLATVSLTVQAVSQARQKISLHMYILFIAAAS